MGTNTECSDLISFKALIEKFVASKDLENLKKLVRRPFYIGANHPEPNSFSDMEEFIKLYAPKSKLVLLNYLDGCFWISGWETPALLAKIWGICHQTDRELEEEKTSCLQWTRFVPGTSIRNYFHN
ncbi:MAG: hypothetical protein R3A13_02500 [Bdellovibrionota bacterium]